MTEPPILSVRGLSVDYRSRRRTVRAVRDVDVTLHAGRTLGLVGESGSGKTTTGRAILGLVAPAAGRIELGGEDITHARERRGALAGRLQVIFQDPYSSLNPARKVGTALLEAAARTDADPRARMGDLLERVDLGPEAAEYYPSRFSGGQRQRLAIARALMPRPSVIVCDEVVSALDVSVQAQILNLLADIQAETAVAYLFIGHDLDVVRHVSHEIAVLHKGEIVETGDATAVVTNPRSEYTRVLVAASRGEAIATGSTRHGRDGPAGA